MGGGGLGLKCGGLVGGVAGWRDRDAPRWREEWGLMGASLPAIALHSSDVICHSKKHLGGQMFSLSQVPPLINTGQVCANIYQCSVHENTQVCARRSV